MKVLPTIYTASALFQLPKQDPDACKEMLLEQWQEGVRQSFNARMTFKIDKLVRRLNFVSNQMSESDSAFNSRSLDCQYIQGEHRKEYEDVIDRTMHSKLGFLLSREETKAEATLAY
ncbi:hypothetical protein [Neptuniibacter sp. QD37_11]|uniref:hypothetical protein n=1 Tax=Neptuniibacter sp. QD37_11 TaxID=3398209 RepID=UPI0039F6398C